MKVYSPALITTKEKILVGHGANLVWCDIIGRRQKQKGDSIEYFFPSWNHQGRRIKEKDGQNLENKLTISENNHRRELNCFGLDDYVEYKDSDPKSRKNAQKYLVTLKDRGFIKDVNGQYFLDIGEIIRRTDFLKILREIKFAPDEQARRRLMDLTHNLNGVYPISKPREFATEIPFSNDNTQKINPIFDLAVSPLLFSEESVDYSIDGSRTMLHGTFIPLAIWAGLFNKPFSRNVCVHGYALGDSEMGVSEFYEKIPAGIINSDVLRYCVLQCTSSFEDTEVNLDRIAGGKKLLYRALNLSKHILKHYGVQKRDTYEDENLGELIENMNIQRAINHFASGILEISRRTHHKGQIDKKDMAGFLRYVNVIKSIFPITIKRLEEIVYYGKL